VAGLRFLAADHGAHAIVEDMFRHAAKGLERGGVTAQQGRQVLVQHEVGPPIRLSPSTSENNQRIRSVPRLVGEHRAEVCEVDLCLAPGRRLEAHLEGRRLDRPDVAQEVSENAVAAGVAEVAQLAVQTGPGQLRKRRKPLAQIAQERRELTRRGGRGPYSGGSRECPENGGMTTREVRSVGSIAGWGNADAMGIAVDCDG
jgi:hypothetical protein